MLPRREKPGGLETEDAINAAIDRLDDRPAGERERARDAADERLQKSRESLTQEADCSRYALRKITCTSAAEKFDNAYTRSLHR